MAFNTDALWVAAAAFTTLCWIIVGIAGLALYRAKR
jgi:uncharacterized membrane protein YuzA (DUF378 family)